MKTDRALFSAQWSETEEAEAQQAGDRECDAVCGEKQLPIAHVAEGFSTVKDAIRPFSVAGNYEVCGNAFSTN